MHRPGHKQFSRPRGVAGYEIGLYCPPMILLRHGQSEFNLHFTATRRDPGIVDPRLTELGHSQAAEAVRELAGERITRIVTSPYTRALQTAAPIAQALGLTVGHPGLRWSRPGRSMIFRPSTRCGGQPSKSRPPQ